AELTSYTLGSHTGTHLDLPSHIIECGKELKDIPLDLLLGDALVIDLSDGRGLINADEIRPHLLPGAKRILIRSSNSSSEYIGSREFKDDYRSLSMDGAELLVEAGISFVGIDYLSIEQFESRELEVHRYLLGHDLVILEGLDLRGVPPGKYEMICLPLKIQNASGAPARVVLRQK
ncbi:cyclase family protein, partial [Methanosarcinales archaeon]